MFSKNALVFSEILLDVFIQTPKHFLYIFSLYHEKEAYFMHTLSCFLLLPPSFEKKRIRHRKQFLTFRAGLIFYKTFSCLF